MWRRLYLLLVLVRLYFAFSPSYLHPDEHFQGPEVVAAKIFGFPAHATWEFTSSSPIRSVFPLWLVYGWPLTALKWITTDVVWDTVPPRVIFYSLRGMMFLLSFVLQDWALYELITVPRLRREAILLVSSSYVTWTWQSHTFSNAIETIIVLWCLVIVKRLCVDETRQLVACIALAFLAVLGTFNRITFPAFMIVPGWYMLQVYWRRPITLLVTIMAAVATTLLAVAVDTEWYTSGSVTLSTLTENAVFTPLNNLKYNLDPANLALHGLHPRYQHLLANMPQLLGPAVLLLYRPRRDMLFWSAVCGLIVLSIFQHQEARFLLPTVPLILLSVNVPLRFRRPFIAAWLVFNLTLGVLMGILHQGGVVPAQLWIAGQHNITTVVWWKTLSPPNYLLGQRASEIETVDLMGIPGSRMMEMLEKHLHKGTVFVAPSSAQFLDSAELHLERLFHYHNHVNLDDLDFADDGVLPTLSRVFGRRGLDVFAVGPS